jgi:hypothetical protein
MNTIQAQNLFIRDAALEITQASGRYCGTDATRKAAKRIGALALDEAGRSVIPRAIVKAMARNYATMGYLIPRNQTSSAGKLPQVARVTNAPLAAACRHSGKPMK